MPQSQNARHRHGPLIGPSAALISHAIQLSTAPVFLRAGIASLLKVMNTRLARSLDRAGGSMSRVCSFICWAACWTGLVNRRALFEQLENLLQSASGALLYVDVDHFKIDQ